MSSRWKLRPKTSGRAIGMLFLVALLLLFGAAILSAKGKSLPYPNALVLLYAVLAPGALLWFSPHMKFYTAGLAGLFLALLGAWLGSPDAAPVINSIVRGGDSFGSRWFGVLFFLFPPAWMLLVRSVSSWLAGIASYFAVGLLFAATASIAGLLGSPWVDQFPPFWILVFAYAGLWPQGLIAMLGAFGYRAG